MKLVDSSVISEPVEFIFNLLNVAVTKHILFSLMNTLYIYVYMDIYMYIYEQIYLNFVADG